MNPQILLTVLMPCLNEADTLATCIGKAKKSMETLHVRGEVLIADNGSTDGSQQIALENGARVINIPEKGYGNALSGGINAANGKYIIMGDADDSYDFLALQPFIEKLEEGYELVMGNRFKGGIVKGAMPFLHRYLGNPILSGVGRILYKSDIRDFHCGLRGFRKESIQSLHLITTGMEFASEMVVKATIHHLQVTEVPTTLSPDGRNRPPHLRSWHDGWRHLKFLLIYSPNWLFLYPGIILTALGIIILGSLLSGPVHIHNITFDIHTMLYGAMFTILGTQTIATALFTRTYAINSGMLPPGNGQNKIPGKFTLEKGLIIGAFMMLLGLIGSVLAVRIWETSSFGDLIPTHTMRLTIPSVTLLILGLQFIFSSFFLYILNIKHKENNDITPITMHSNNFCTKYLGNRNLVYICLAIIVCVFVVNHLKIFDFKPDLNGDNVYYYALGKALASGKGYTDIMFFEETPHAHFPPGYPLFNAGILAFTDSYTALKIANGILFGLSVLLLFFLIKKISNNLLLALATCLLCSMQQAMLRYSTIVMSEMLFTFLTLAVLYLFTLIDTDRLFSKSRPRSQIVCFIGMIVCLNYIYYVRTMGTSIILAVIIYMGITCMKKATRYIKSKRTHADHALQTTNKRALGSNLIVLCIIITSFAGAKTAWDTRNKSIGVTGSDYLKDFKKKPKGETMATFSDWTGRFQNNLTNYVRKWIPTAVIPELVEKNTKASPSDITRGVFILGIILYGLITLKSLQLLLFLYIGITMGVLMIWPEQYAGHRYFIAVIPFFIFLFLNGCLEILKAATRKIGKSKYKEVIPAGALILFIVFFMFPRYAKALKPQQNFAKHKLWNEKIAEPPFVEYIYAVNWCKTNLPENTRIACRKPELFYLFSGGRKSTSFPQYATPEELFERFKNQQISQVIIDRWFRHGYVTVYPMIQQYPKHFRPLIQIGKNTEEQLPTLVFQFSPREITPTPTEVPK